MGRISSRGSLGMADGALGIFTGQILVNIASQSDIDQLTAPANAENRLASLVESLEYFQFEPIPLIIGPSDLPFGFLSKQGGIHIRPPRDDQPIKQTDILFSFDPGYIRKDHGDSP